MSGETPSTVRVQYWCPGCGDRAMALDPVTAEPQACAGCGHRLEPQISDALRGQGVVDRCLVCGGRRFYLQKDFNRALGLGIVGIMILASTWLYAKFGFYAYFVLFSFILLDIWAYRVLSLVTVCYQCKAIYRGNRIHPEHKAFNLAVADRFGPE